MLEHWYQTYQTYQTYRSLNEVIIRPSCNHEGKKRTAVRTEWKKLPTVPDRVLPTIIFFYFKMINVLQYFSYFKTPKYIGNGYIIERPSISWLFTFCLLTLPFPATWIMWTNYSLSSFSHPRVKRRYIEWGVWIKKITPIYFFCSKYQKLIS